MLKRPTQIVFRWIPASVWMGMTFSASTSIGSAPRTSRYFEPFIRSLFPAISPENLNLLHLIFRKGGHLTGYAILGSLLWWALGAHFSRPEENRRRFTLAWLIAILYAASDEFHQSFVPGRGAAATDVMIDAAGAALALTAIALVLKYCIRRREPEPASVALVSC